jgi:hypothetical protein
MNKTKLIIKDDQVLIDADVLFEQIEAENGNWQKVRQMYEELKKSVGVGIETAKE